MGRDNAETQAARVGYRELRIWDKIDKKGPVREDRAS
jgi:hypothetical protein